LPHNKEFAALSAACRTHLKAGEIREYVSDLRKIGDIFRLEGRYTDELKVLLLAYYTDLNLEIGNFLFFSGDVPHILQAAAKSSLSPEQIRELYFETVGENTVPACFIRPGDAFKILSIGLDFDQPCE